jgi:AhpD family alkylhydroperoxidase
VALNEGEVELISIGASIAAGCRHCLDVHVREARKWGVSDEEIRSAMTRALHLRESAQSVIEKHGSKLLKLKLFRDNSARPDLQPVSEVPGTRVGELIAIASAFAVNCTANLEKHLAAARAIGVSEDEIEKAIDISRFVKGKADSLCCKWV